MRDFDLIVVGGGIAGGSLATVMARNGASVLVLERQSRYRDRVRGELLWPWGVEVARRLGLEPVLLDAGALVVPWMELRTEGSSLAERREIGLAVEEVGGSVNLSHPVACTALVESASAAGAAVRLGARDVHVSPGSRPEVRWRDAGGEAREATARVVVGADGRRSAVRAQASIPFEVDEPAHLIAGLLLDGFDGMPEDVNLAARESDLLFLAFPQSPARARVYFNYPHDQTSRFAGSDAAGRFLDACRLACLQGEPWHDARAAGPCAAFAGADSRAPWPLAEGVVLVGDAAGYENPLRGQGLAMALQDVHDVTSALLADDPVNGLRAYAEARATRQRLANLATELTVWANEGFRVQDPAERAARDEHLRRDDIFAALSSSIWAGFTRVPQNVTAADVAERLATFA